MHAMPRASRIQGAISCIAATAVALTGVAALLAPGAAATDSNTAADTRIIAKEQPRKEKQRIIAREKQRTEKQRIIAREKQRTEKQRIIAREKQRTEKQRIIAREKQRIIA
ncbi:hypothetical protein BH20ACT6_BH20ACT6_06140 [soil metagenome]